MIRLNLISEENARQEREAYLAWEERTLRPHDNACDDCRDARKRSIASLCFLPKSHRELIKLQCALPSPPPKWLYFGSPDDPSPLSYCESRAWFEWYRSRGIDPTKQRETIPQRIRSAVIERDGYVCQICLLPVDPSDVHLDHIEMYHLGGPTTVDNLRVTHSQCNLRRPRKP